jgi:hypothetical protein
MLLAECEDEMEIWEEARLRRRTGSTGGSGSLVMPGSI